MHCASLCVEHGVDRTHLLLVSERVRVRRVVLANAVGGRHVDASSPSCSLPLKSSRVECSRVEWSAVEWSAAEWSRRVSKGSIKSHGRELSC